MEGITAPGNCLHSTTYRALGLHISLHLLTASGEAEQVLATPGKDVESEAERLEDLP